MINLNQKPINDENELVSVFQKNPEIVVFAGSIFFNIKP